MGDNHMYVCICKAVTEKQIQQAVKSGVVESYKCLRDKTGLGTQCGKCGTEAKSFLQQCSANQVTQF